jgi:D-alanyl-D-alanine carboxypeptidase
MPNLSRSARALIGTLLLLAALPAAATAQAPNARLRLDSLFDILETNQRVMGTVSIRRGDRVLYQRSLGYRDSAATGWVRADSATMYRVGSITKPFTAVMVYQLIDERRLTLDTKLSRFFPQLPHADSITIRDLLGHTSGLPDFTQGMDVRRSLTRDSILTRIATMPAPFRAGTRRRYNNSNYVLLGYIVESVTSSSYAVQLERRIARRAGLKRTRFGGAVDPARNESRAYYFGDNQWQRQADDAIDNADGAGAIVSTTSDLTRFLAAIFAGRLISPSSRHELTHGFVEETRTNGKGLGPFTIPGTTKSGHSHDGSIGAHTALMGYVPEDSLALALTINGHNYPINRVFFQVWDILYGTAAPLPTFAPVPLPDSIATPLVGTYTAPDYGITIAVRRTGQALEAQTVGQDPFPLTYIGDRRFLFVPAGIMIEFGVPTSGSADRFTLFQQKLAIAFRRREPAP